jgi:hypothetical protein
MEGTMAETTLQELVLSYRASGKGMELIMERVAALVYSAHVKFGFDDEDDAANALMKYRGRIARLVDRFEDRGVPFDAFLASSLRYLAKTVRRDRKQARDRESVCERAVAVGDEARGSFEAGLYSETAGDGYLPPEGNPRLVPRRRPRARGGIVRCGELEKAAFSSRLVYLALKCAWEIDEEGVARVAASAGVDPGWLSAAVEQARRSLAGERSRVETLVQRRNASWCRQRLLESRLAVEPDPYRRSRISAARERERRHCAKVKEELGCLRTPVPNSVVARILGVPKGTVDSGLYYLRKRYGPDKAAGPPSDRG